MTPENLPHVFIFTDGSSTGKIGPGGWACMLRFGETEKELAGNANDTTNNRMELQAVISGLTALTRPCVVEVVTDSQYVRDGFRYMRRWKVNGWKLSTNDPVKNQDLWQALDDAARQHEVTLTWIKGHQGHPENERMDKLAKQARAALDEK